MECERAFRIARENLVGDIRLTYDSSERPDRRYRVTVIGKNTWAASSWSNALLNAGVGIVPLQFNMTSPEVTVEDWIKQTTGLGDRLADFWGVNRG